MSESDEETALGGVEEKEHAMASGTRGRPNTSLQHFETPVAILESSDKKRWSFKDKFCPACMLCPSLGVGLLTCDAPVPGHLSGQPERVLPSLRRRSVPN